ncbi:hypothetical protein GGR04_000500 [Aureimonas pseudogalii]|uniref:Uncharacterized protein n=1 Tax=Aureimonas pseudogalii TaxID=1744844 RepID=A0A7W6H465_9HYPH|nr:hypothetical protein [Aureimonas pseudogalii]
MRPQGRRCRGNAPASERHAHTRPRVLTRIVPTGDRRVRGKAAPKRGAKPGDVVCSRLEARTRCERRDRRVPSATCETTSAPEG